MCRRFKSGLRHRSFCWHFRSSVFRAPTRITWPFLRISADCGRRSCNEDREPFVYVVYAARRIRLGPLTHVPAHAVRSATAGGTRDARTAGSRPASAPMRMAEMMPPDHASTGITTAQLLELAYTAVAAAPASTPTTPPLTPSRIHSPPNHLPPPPPLPPTPQRTRLPTR